MARAPLAQGDDGSGFRYGVRHICADGYVAAGHKAECLACVPAALIASTPERFDPPCEGDEVTDRDDRSEAFYEALDLVERLLNGAIAELRPCEGDDA